MARATCYCINSGIVSTRCANAVPCGESNANGFVQCCRSIDTCHPKGFCYTTDTGVLQRIGSNWYLGGCTDSTFNDESCPHPCRDLQKSNVVYNESTNKWTCCWNPNELTGTGAPNCSRPSNETFDGLPPKEILAASWSASFSTESPRTYFTSSSPLPSTTQSASASTQSISTLPSVTDSPSSGGLEIGAKAGIGVGAVLGSLIIIILLAMFVVRRNTRGTHRDHKLSTRLPPWLLQRKSRNRHPKQGDISELYSPPGNVVVELDAQNGELRGPKA